jgi:hypothetical protein
MKLKTLSRTIGFLIIGAVLVVSKCSHNKLKNETKQHQQTNITILE